MRLLVCGGRYFSDRRSLWVQLERIDVSHCIDCLIEGEADGADKLARQWAERRGVPFHPFPAAWDDIDHPGAVARRNRQGRLYDASAGTRRNTQMIVEGQPTHILAAPGGTGTANMIAQAEKAGIISIPWDGPA